MKKKELLNLPSVNEVLHETNDVKSINIEYIKYIK